MSRVNVKLIVKWNHEDNIPEVLDCWDEYVLDSWPEGFDEKLTELRAEHDCSVVVVETWFDDAEVEKALTHAGLTGRPA